MCCKQSSSPTNGCWNTQHIFSPLLTEIQLDMTWKLLQIAWFLWVQMLLPPGDPDHQMQKLQCVMNASVWLIFCTPEHSCHITLLALLQQFHWFPISLHVRIKFKILLITFKVLELLAPKYLIDLISVLSPSQYHLQGNNNGILLNTPSVSQKLPWAIDPSWQ